jgi:hypothetical protein
LNVAEEYIPARRRSLAPESKRSALVFLLIALILTVLIGAGVPHLKFKPGMPLPSFADGQVALPAAEEAAPVGLQINAFAGILALIILGVFVIFMIVRMLKGVKWTKLLSGLWSIFWKFLLVAALLFLVVSLLPKSEGTSSAELLPPPKPLVTAPLGPVPPAVIWMAGLVLVSIVLFIGARMIAAKRRPVSRTWEWEAEKARQALLDGQDLREVIIQCYLRMGQALQEEQQIQREAFMTTGEFEVLLSARGVPADPVHQLTRLFDSVRYGRSQPASGEEQSALQCLNAILAYSRQSQQAT